MIDVYDTSFSEGDLVWSTDLEVVCMFVGFDEDNTITHGTPIAKIDILSSNKKSEGIEPGQRWYTHASALEYV